VATLDVTVVSPEREVWTGEADMVVARGTEGDVGILPDHAPMLVALAGRPVRIVHGNAEEVVLVHGGFLHVTPGEDRTRVDILAEEAELASEVSAPEARARVEELRRRVEQGETEAEAELAQALVRAEFGTG
jgi:F-type H+-transporting ATPase subunit epsilon